MFGLVLDDIRRDEQPATARRDDGHLAARSDLAFLAPCRRQVEVMHVPGLLHIANIHTNIQRREGVCYRGLLTI